MANILIKGLTLIILLVTVTVIECQVILNRNQLATWIPSYLTATTMDLTFKKISLIDTATFSGLSILQALYLHYNLLTNIDSNTFSGLTNLYFLRLAWNQISFIDSQTFSKLKNLKSLWLNKNLLTCLNPATSN